MANYLTTASFDLLPPHIPIVTLSLSFTVVSINFAAMDSFEDVDTDVRGKFYRGISKVSLDAINFDHPLVKKKVRPWSPKNVRRLEKIFRQSGCKRGEEENFINAIIDDTALEIALGHTGTSIDAFHRLRESDTLPYLNLQSVDCLSGQHRVAAAKRFLDPNDQWWVVRFFSKGKLLIMAVTSSHADRLDIPKKQLSEVIEAYGNEERPPDGEIFRRIRYYHLLSDEESELRWWSLLDNSKPKDLRQLIKRKNLIAAFDDLRHMPGLWSKVQLGALHRLLALKCDEVNPL
jgi:hypothetical protein